MGITATNYKRIPPPSKPPLVEAERAIGCRIITNLIALQLCWVRTTRTSAPLLGSVLTTRMYAPPLGRVMTRVSLQGWLNPCHYIQDDANKLDVTAQVRDLPRMGIPLPNSDYKTYTYNKI